MVVVLYCMANIKFFRVWNSCEIGQVKKSLLVVPQRGGRIQLDDATSHDLRISITCIVFSHVLSKALT